MARKRTQLASGQPHQATAWQSPPGLPAETGTQNISVTLPPGTGWFSIATSGNERAAWSSAACHSGRDIALMECLQLRRRTGQ